MSAAPGVVEGDDAAAAFYKNLAVARRVPISIPVRSGRSRNQIITWDDLNTLLERTRIA